MAFKSYQAGGIPANFQQAQSNTHTNAQADRAQTQLLPTLTEPTKNWSFTDMNYWILVLVQFMMAGRNQPSPQTNQNLSQFIICLLQIHLHVHFWTKLLLSGYLMQVSAQDVLQCVKGVLRGDCVGVTHSLAFLLDNCFSKKEQFFS